jgi:hypothetical protein
LKTRIPNGFTPKIDTKQRRLFVFAGRILTAVRSFCANFLWHAFQDKSAGEPNSNAILNSMKVKLKLSSFHSRFLLICVGAGAKTRIHSIPAN